jgi:hypothetical protein
VTEQGVTPRELPRPTEWTRRDRRMWFGPCVIAAVVLAGVSVVVGRDNLIAGLIWGAAALVLLGVALTFPLPRPWRVSLTDRGVHLPPLITMNIEGIELRGRQPIPWERITDTKAWKLDLFYDWLPIRQNMISIEAVNPDAERRPRWYRWALASHDHHTVRVVRLRTEPVLAYHAMRFYWQNPDARAELASEEAVERIREGRF